MRDFVIFGDSTCDLSKELRQQYGIDYIPMNYVVDDVEYVASLDWEERSPKEFYDLMRSGKRAFTTQIPRDVCREKFLSALENGKDIVYIACSSALSSSYQTACVVAKELAGDFPEAGIYCVDALNSSLGQGIMLLDAAQLREQGKSAGETAAWIEETRLNVHMVGTPATLEYLRRAGRVNASSAFFGNLFGVKPIIISDRKGQNYAVKKVKGLANARSAIADMIVDAMTEESNILYIGHADALEDAIALRDEILKRASFAEVRMGVIGPIVGASVGPGMIGAFIRGKEVMLEGNNA